MTNEEMIKARVDVDRRITDALDILMAQYTKPKEKFVTPDGIWFDSRGILFPNKKQVLLYAQGVYKIHSPLLPRQNRPLTPCAWKDLKPGDVYFGTPRNDMTAYNTLYCYGVKLDELKSVYIDDEVVTVETYRYDYNYKVEL